MIFIFGSRLYGKVERLSNGWHIATRFGHLDYLPLFPMGSCLVIEQSGKSWRGIPLPLQWRSIVLAYARVWLTVVAVIAGFGAVAMTSSGSRNTPVFELIVGDLISLIIVATAIGSFVIWRKATPEREAAILKLVEAKLVSGKLPAGRGFDVEPGMPAPASAVAVPVPAYAGRAPARAQPLESIPLEEPPLAEPAAATPLGLGVPPSSR